MKQFTLVSLCFLLFLSTIDARSSSSSFRSSSRSSSSSSVSSSTPSRSSSFSSTPSSSSRSSTSTFRSASPSTQSISTQTFSSPSTQTTSKAVSTSSTDLAMKKASAIGFVQYTGSNGKAQAVTDKQVQSQKQYTTTFDSKPVQRPVYVPVYINHGSDRYSVIFNPVYHGYGYWYIDPYTHTRIWYTLNNSDMIQDPQPASHSDMMYIFWVIIGLSVLFLVVYFAKKIF